MPTVADLPPPRPVLPAIPPRLLSSASAPDLAPAPPETSTRVTIEDIRIEPVFHNPESDLEYGETWDAYWARVRPQRNRPYSQTSRPKSTKESCSLYFAVVFVLGLYFTLSRPKSTKESCSLYFAVVLFWDFTLLFV